MLLARLALGAAGAWVAYAWGAHLLAPAYAWRGPRGRRGLALTFDDGPDPD
jgi:peptidoglycan/xylan/chitin deacetylase (PgdA/CDA1 family)